MVSTLKILVGHIRERGGGGGGRGEITYYSNIGLSVNVYVRLRYELVLPVQNKYL